MVKKINLCGTSENTDPFYRYQRNELDVHTHKTKTSINNLSITAADMKRTEKEIITYFKCKLGISFSSKKTGYITPKLISKEDLEKCLKEYVDDYVLCKKCELPETTLEVDDDKLLANCSCCSYVHTYKEEGKNGEIIRKMIKLLNKKKSKKNKGWV